MKTPSPIVIAVTRFCSCSTSICQWRLFSFLCLNNT